MVENLVNKYKLYIPNGYKDLNSTQKTKLCNGCGPSGWKYKFNKILWCDVSEACNIHDYMYAKADPYIEFKDEADRVFLNNLLRIVISYSANIFMEWLRKKIAYSYYLAVKKFGGPAFWSNKNNDN